jgi:hypothetical protein
MRLSEKSLKKSGVDTLASCPPRIYRRSAGARVTFDTVKLARMAHVRASGSLGTRQRVEPSAGIEPATSSLPMTCSTTELQGHRRRDWSGRRESNSRLLLGRQRHYHYATPALVGRAGFEPAYRDAEQIYSLSPLTTRPPTQTGPRFVSARVARVLSEPTIGFEPMTLTLQKSCSNQLSYVGTRS